MLEEIGLELEQFIYQSQIHIVFVFKIIGFLWAVNIINWVMGSKLNRLGLIPRRIYGLPGIIFSPILHADPGHLFFNSIPLFMLSLFIISQGLTGLEKFYEATVLIWIISGIVLWCVGRRGNHIGASGIIAGYFAFILSDAYHNPGITTLFAGGLALYYFGSIFFSIFPSEARVSWEGHLVGFLAGIASVFIISYQSVLIHYLSFIL